LSCSQLTSAARETDREREREITACVSHHGGILVLLRAVGFRLHNPPAPPVMAECRTFVPRISAPGPNPKPQPITVTRGQMLGGICLVTVVTVVACFRRSITFRGCFLGRAHGQCRFSQVFLTALLCDYVFIDHVIGPCTVQSIRSVCFRAMTYVGLRNN